MSLVCTVILGAPDPEMEAVEKIAREAGLHVVYAMNENGQRIRANETAKLDFEVTGVVATVECKIEGLKPTISIDHHSPGDYGFGQPPARYWQASSIGQFARAMDIEPTEELRLIAAADHCLRAAYQGQCPGVDPDKLMNWRIESRSKFQKIPAFKLREAIEFTSRILDSAPDLVLATVGNAPCTKEHDVRTSVCDKCKDFPIMVRDMRNPEPWPELPEAAAINNVGYVSGPLIGRDGSRKFTCAGLPEQVQAFMQHWAPKQGLTGIYGDPARGFAGGYDAKSGN